MVSIDQIKKYKQTTGFVPSKHLGQNFLVDTNIIKKLLHVLSSDYEPLILEIGPGFGQLTEYLLEFSSKIHACEKDKLLYAYLREHYKDNKNIIVHNNDILKFQLKPLSEESSTKRISVIGNIPYNITSPIIEYLIVNRKYIKNIALLVQKEFAERLYANINTKQYSSFTCFVNYYANVKKLFTVKRTCFYPAPDVDSQYISLEFDNVNHLKCLDEKLLFCIIRSTFQERRKMMVKILSKVLKIDKQILCDMVVSLKLDEKCRPEQLSLNNFIELTNMIKNSKY